jgi:hypothetical protein
VLVASSTVDALSGSFPSARSITSCPDWLRDEEQHLRLGSLVGV